MKRSKEPVPVRVHIIPTMVDETMKIGALDLSEMALKGTREWAVVVRANDQRCGVLIGKVKLPKGAKLVQFYLEFPREL